MSTDSPHGQTPSPAEAAPEPPAYSAPPGYPGAPGYGTQAPPYADSAAYPTQGYANQGYAAPGYPNQAYAAPQAPVYTGYPAYGQGYYPPVAPTNSLAIVALITGILGISIVAIITGHIGINRINRTGEQGKGMAIAGLVLGYVGALSWVIFWIIWFSFWATFRRYY